MRKGVTFDKSVESKKSEVAALWLWTAESTASEHRQRLRAPSVSSDDILVYDASDDPCSEFSMVLGCENCGNEACREEALKGARCE